MWEEPCVCACLCVCECVCRECVPVCASSYVRRSCVCVHLVRLYVYTCAHVCTCIHVCARAKFVSVDARMYVHLCVLSLIHI